MNVILSIDHEVYDWSETYRKDIAKLVTARVHNEKLAVDYFTECLLAIEDFYHKGKMTPAYNLQDFVQDHTGFSTLGISNSKDTVVLPLSDNTPLNIVLARLAYAFLPVGHFSGKLLLGKLENEGSYLLLVSDHYADGWDEIKKTDPLDVFAKEGLDKRRAGSSCSGGSSFSSCSSGSSFSSASSSSCPFEERPASNKHASSDVSSDSTCLTWDDYQIKSLKDDPRY